MIVLVDLPVEIIQHIATYLPACSDLLNFCLSSRKVHNAVLVTQAVCRELFLCSYDKPTKWEHYDYKHVYWWRCHTLQQFLDDKNPSTASGSLLTTRMLDGVKQLMLETRSKNFSHLRRFTCRSTNLITAIPDLSSPPATLLMTLQLLLFNFAATNLVAWADDPLEAVHSQKWAYGDGERGLFESGGIDAADLTRLWRTVNFFLLHFNGAIKPEDEEHSGLKMSGLKLEFERIKAEGQGVPGPWKRLGDEAVPKYWFGFYVYLEPQDVHKLRAGTITTPLQDQYDGRLSIMELNITDTTFTGHGSDVEPFTVKGDISPLPSIASIPGWRRISFEIKYPEDRWHYEGCLLPGARTIVGRWTTFEEDETGEPETNGWEGPFVMWAVSGPYYAYEKGWRDPVACVDDFLNH